MTDNSLVMTFINQEGTKASITLPGVREDVTELEVSAAMDAIISKNIFTSSGGDLVAKHSAQVTARTVTAMVVK
jgi:hypothetical protein